MGIPHLFFDVKNTSDVQKSVIWGCRKWRKTYGKIGNE